MTNYVAVVKQGLEWFRDCLVYRSTRLALAMARAAASFAMLADAADRIAADAARRQGGEEEE